jgi:uncharacterized protein (TIRG00374 family)
VLGAAIAVAVAAALLVIARPTEIWRLLRTTDPSLLSLAAGASGAALLFRGVRLVLLLPRGRLRVLTGTTVAATAHAAVMFVPARIGELAVPLLLRRTAGCDLAEGVSALLAARALDVASLGVGAGAAVLAVWGLGEPIALLAALVLVIPPLLLPRTLAAGDWIAVRALATRGLRGRRWARRIRRVRRAVDELRQRPIRVLGAAAASLGMWFCLWSTAWLLLAAMGYRWQVARVVAGSAVATLANLLPVHVIGNIGPMEAGWTAGFSAFVTAYP